MVKVTNQDLWNSLSRNELWIRHIRVYEVLFISAFAVVMMLIEGSIDFGSEMPIPERQTSSGSEPNLLFSYPIYLDGHECWPSDLSICASSPDLKSDCCNQLQNSNSAVFETVSTMDAVLIAGFVSIGVIILRVLCWRKYVSQYQFIKIDDRYWLKIVWDMILAGVFSIIFTVVITDFIKLSVGAPRPIYYALKTYSSVHKGSRQWYKDNSQLSFPSGHASSTISVLGMATIVCLNDALFFRERSPIAFLALSLLSLMPASVAVFIGVSRIVDMWHFAWDVIAGWMVGGVIAVLCIYIFSGQGVKVSRTITSLMAENSKDRSLNEEEDKVVV